LEFLKIATQRKGLMSFSLSAWLLCHQAARQQQATVMPVFGPNSLFEVLLQPKGIYDGFCILQTPEEGLHASSHA